MGTAGLNNQSHSFEFSENTRKSVFITALAVCLFPVICPPLALLLGLILAQLIDNPFAELAHKSTHWLLQISVVGLGFGMNIFNALHAGREGILFTIVSIVTVLTTGMLAGRFLKIDKITTFLISAGTAICGGSAIAALSPAVGAKEKQISVSMGVIFILNSVALFIFPVIGHRLHVSQTQFGLWCAVAIHDTSSVVGAASRYGAQALQVATTIKLARGLWVIPLAVVSSFFFKTDSKKVKIPYFIGLFVAAMLINTYVPLIKPVVPYISALAETGFTLTLFLIGTSLSFKKLNSVGVVPFLMGAGLWAFISGASLWAILRLA